MMVRGKNQNFYYDMFKVLLKHHIYELCIKTVFNALIKNFSRFKGFKAGDTFKVIHLAFYGSDDFRSYHEVTITSIREESFDNIVVYFSYTNMWDFHKLEKGEYCNMHELGNSKGQEYRVRHIDMYKGTKHTDETLITDIRHYD